jgi:flagellar biosynthesis protein FlhB
MDEEAADKPYEATPRKLQQARDKGEFARSKDLHGGVAFLGFLAVALAMGGVIFNQAGEILAALLAGAGEASARGADLAFVTAALIELVGPVLLLLGIPALFVVAAVTVEQGWVFAPQKVAPKLNRISPIGNAKQKFGRSGLFEFAKSAAKLLIVSACFALFARSRLPDFAATMGLETRAVAHEIVAHSLDFLVLVGCLAVLFAVIDVLWQQADHLRKQRMSRKELVDEMKESEGDPAMKQQRRQRGYDLANNRMIADVPTADVVIVNPLHYAVALKWERTSGGAPVCVAKGMDEVALRIRTAAMEAGVPIRHDPPTARALHAAVKVGQEIHPDQYRPVAAAIRFADAMRRRARDPRKR